MSESEGEQMSQTLPTTSKAAGFDAVITEVQHQHTLGLANPHQLRLFHLAVQSNRFDHADLVTYLRRNIGRYVFSRADLAEYERNENTEMVALDAVGRILGQEGAQGLGELMLYILLEQVLKAPKVLSKIELNRAAGRVRSRCDAIHLYTPDGAAPVSSIVFGTSSVIGDMRDAIDQAFDKIVQIETNTAAECQLAEEQVFTKTMDSASAQTIRDLLVPQKGGALVRDTAYGVFLGYDLGLQASNYANADYRAQLDAKMALDLAHHTAYIVNKINAHQLGTHSFYIYLLPFDNCGTDCDVIMRKVLGSGGGAAHV